MTTTTSEQEPVPAVNPEPAPVPKPSECEPNWQPVATQLGIFAVAIPSPSLSWLAFGLVSTFIIARLWMPPEPGCPGERWAGIAALSLASGLRAALIVMHPLSLTYLVFRWVVLITMFVPTGWRLYLGLRKQPPQTIVQRVSFYAGMIFICWLWETGSLHF